MFDNKWTIDQLKYHFRDCGYDYDLIWLKIEKIIVLTCVNLCSMCPNYENCFELMGFDIMIDQQLKPWLLEVNSSPAMSMDGVADNRVKPDLLKDTFKLIDFEPYEDYVDRISKKSRKHENHIPAYTKQPVSSTMLSRDKVA